MTYRIDFELFEGTSLSPASLTNSSHPRPRWFRVIQGAVLAMIVLFIMAVSAAVPLVIAHQTLGDSSQVGQYQISDDLRIAAWQTITATWVESLVGIELLLGVTALIAGAVLK